MLEINHNQFLTKPYPYQIDGIKHVLKQPFTAIFDEMGVGKTKQTIDAASILFENGKIVDTVVVVCPKSVQSTWDSSETGEITKHCYSDFGVIRFDANFKQKKLPTLNNALLWITVSYDYLRSKLSEFLTLLDNRQIFVIYDESSYIKSPNAQRTKACKALRRLAKRAVILNGTPIANNIIDLWAQFDVLDPQAIDNIGYYHFRARYCLLGGYENKQILNLIKEKEDTIRKIKELSEIKDINSETTLILLERRLADIERIEESIEKLKVKLKPWVIRREKKDVLSDLPDKLPPVLLEAQMTPNGYRVYREMANNLVAWANEAEYSQAPNAAVKAGRLAQITSGFLGGIEELEEIDNLSEAITPKEPITEVDDSKLKAFIEWYECNRHLKVVVWCYFRAQIFRLEKELKKLGVKTGLLIGGQRDREQVLSDAKAGKLDILIAHPAAGGYGVDGLQHHFYTCVYMSLRYNLIHFQQSSDRLHRNGQKMPVSYIFILCVGPQGGKTVDHLILKALTDKEDMAKWTMDRWREEIKKL